jgi:hypothetical protein
VWFSEGRRIGTGGLGANNCSKQPGVGVGSGAATVFIYVTSGGYEYHGRGGDIVAGRRSAAEREAINSSRVEHSWRRPDQTIIGNPLEVTDVQLRMRACTVGEIKSTVAYFFGMSVKELDQRSTAQAVMVPRQIAMYLARQMTDSSLAEIGRQFGGMHYTTVMHSIMRVEEQRKTRDRVELAIRIILEGIKY